MNLQDQNKNTKTKVLSGNLTFSRNSWFMSNCCIKTVKIYEDTSDEFAEPIYLCSGCFRSKNVVSFY